MIALTAWLNERDDTII